MNLLRPLHLTIFSGLNYKFKFFCLNATNADKELQLHISFIDDDDINKMIKLI